MIFALQVGVPNNDSSQTRQSEKPDIMLAGYFPAEDNVNMGFQKTFLKQSLMKSAF